MLASYSDVPPSGFELAMCFAISRHSRLGPGAVSHGVEFHEECLVALAHHGVNETDGSFLLEVELHLDAAARVNQERQCQGRSVCLLKLVICWSLPFSYTLNSS